MFQKINKKHLKKLLELAPKGVFFDEETRAQFGSDETEDFIFIPEVVVKPKNTDEVVAVMKWCYANHIAVTPVGARTGLSGGALTVCGGVALSMEYFDRIIHIDEDNLQVTVEPGVITQVLQEAVAKKNLFYPPDPASRGSCFIGGNVAENSGGPKAVKYGVTSDYVLNLELVLPNGEVIWTGANVLKNATGYNLTQLLVGSEGTLGVITQIVLRLIPLPRENKLMLVPFQQAEDACRAVAAIFKAGIVPSAMEFMERDALIFTTQFLKESPVKIAENDAAHLLIELDGNDADQLMMEMEKLFAVLEAYPTNEVLLAETTAQKEALWQMRRKVGEAVKANSVYKEEDTVVPRYELVNLLKGVKEIGRKYGFQSVCYGHAGDGNLHVNILKGSLSDEDWNTKLKEAIRAIFELTASLGGTISGEHGIGFVQREFLDIVFTKTQLELMKKIKGVFDPKGIMNPGKIFMD